VNILEAIISGYDTNTTGLPKVYSNKTSPTRNVNVDGLMFVCNQCSVVWQRPISGGENKNFNYYDDFPTIGKKRKRCPKCEKQK